MDNENEDQIIENDGYVQSIPEVSEEIKRIYKTAWEIKAKALVGLSADCAPVVDQFQSFNVFISTYNFLYEKEPTFKSPIKPQSLNKHSKIIYVIY